MAECQVFKDERAELFEGITGVAPTLGKSVTAEGVSDSIITAFLLTADETILPFDFTLSLQQKRDIVKLVATFLKCIHTHVKHKSHTHHTPSPPLPELGNACSPPPGREGPPEDKPISGNPPAVTRQTDDR